MSQAKINSFLVLSYITSLFYLHQIIILRKHPSILRLKYREINILVLDPLNKNLREVYTSFITEWEATTKTRIQFQYTISSICPLHNIHIQITDMTQNLSYLTSYLTNLWKIHSNRLIRLSRTHSQFLFHTDTDIISFQIIHHI